MQHSPTELQLRRKRKLSLSKCAHLTGFSPETLDQFELGKNKISIEALLRLAQVFRVELQALLEMPRGDAAALEKE